MDIKEPAVSYNNKKYTIEEYLEMEQGSQEKHEYYQGEIYAMSGPKVQHGIISGNIFGALFERLKGKSCRPFMANNVFTSRKTLCLLTLIFLSFAVKLKQGIMMTGIF